MMDSLQTTDKRYLESLFGTRVSFDRRECTLYGHDTAEIPSLIKHSSARRSLRR